MDFEGFQIQIIFAFQPRNSIVHFGLLKYFFPIFFAYVICNNKFSAIINIMNLKFREIFNSFTLVFLELLSGLVNSDCSISNAR